ncbi:MAG: sugar phosphate isomerase/epimerase family protein, partial [Beutenbergiaceae bacterium]
MPNPPVSVQLYTVRSAISENLDATLERIAKIGFTNVEPYQFADNSNEVASALAKHGLTALSGHAVVDAANAASAVDAAAALGMTTLIHPFIPEERWRTKDSVQQIAAEINALAELGRQRGLRVGYHNHWWELEQQISGRPALWTFIDELDDDVVLEVDTYWAQVGGVDPADLLTRLGSRVTHLHLKD